MTNGNQYTLLTKTQYDRLFRVHWNSRSAKKHSKKMFAAQAGWKIYRIILVVHDAHYDLRYLETVAGRLALIFHHQAERAFVLR